MKRTTNKFCFFVLGAAMAITSLGTSMAPVEAGELRLKRNNTQHQIGGAGGGMGKFSAGFVLNCASGFTMAGKKVGPPSTWTDWYVCSTPVLTCPTQVQENGLKSGIHPKAIVQTIGGNPDGGTVSFRVQYKCDYSFTPIPEG